jgi:Mg/Co/Ni transporter MgtE
VVDSQGQVVGRVTVDDVLEYVRERKEAQELGKVGLREGRGYLRERLGRARRTADPGSR